MPELPEVETILQGIKPHIEQQLIKEAIIRFPSLRWPISANIHQKLNGVKIEKIERCAKYLLFKTSKGTLIIHLGMSGKLRVFRQKIAAGKHDHIDIEFENGKILRFTDPRRFGAFLWTEKSLQQHPLLKDLGLEPFDKKFTGNYLWQKTRNRKIAIKLVIMNQRVVVGLGNIYAAEALFCAHIDPTTPAKNISLKLCNELVKSIHNILKKAIKQGGTTLKDFIDSEGKPGYFKNSLKVYGRAGLPCTKCTTLLTKICIGQRSTVYCKKCQV